jgi:hypothetical protein
VVLDVLLEARDEVLDRLAPPVHMTSSTAEHLRAAVCGAIQ